MSKLWIYTENVSRIARILLREASLHDGKNLPRAGKGCDAVLHNLEVGG